MKDVKPHTCDGCSDLQNCINGRYCLSLNIYVEWIKDEGKPCRPES